MARKQPSKQGESRAHEAAESPEFERGEEEGMKEAQDMKSAAKKKGKKGKKNG